MENHRSSKINLQATVDLTMEYDGVIITGWERTGQMLCIVDTSLSVLMTLRICLRELCCLFNRLDLNHLVRVFYLFMFS